MDFFQFLTMVGGLAMFLYGMTLMGNALEKRAGTQLKTILGRMTDNKIKGFLLGFVVTAIIQSSSATTVMVVGFVNSGIMSLSQSIGIIMGANVGTTVTAWLLSLDSLPGGDFIMELFKPSSFAPVLAMVGTILFMFVKNARKRDTGLILIGFALLLLGMNTMSGAVSGLRDVPAFSQALLLFSNPFLGVLVGAVLTAIIQSSSASVGILQALSATGQMTCATAFPIILGQNIGTCVTALISCVGTNKNARRAAMVHLLFNVISTIVFLIPYSILDALALMPLSDMYISPIGIAIFNTTFKFAGTLAMLPFSAQLEKLACLLVRDSKKQDELHLLDERLMMTPAVALGRAKEVACAMANLVVSALESAIAQFENYNAKQADQIRADEALADQYEDQLGTYLVQLSSHELAERDSHELSEILRIIGDLERISDHAVNLLESAEEIRDKKMAFSGVAERELRVMTDAVSEALHLARTAFCEGSKEDAAKVEPLEQVVDLLRDQLKVRHIERLRQGKCTIELGFVLSDILTNLERVSDHCSNIAACVIETAHDTMDMHGYLSGLNKEQGSSYQINYQNYLEKYTLA